MISRRHRHRNFRHLLWCARKPASKFEQDFQRIGPSVTESVVWNSELSGNGKADEGKRMDLPSVFCNYLKRQLTMGVISFWPPQLRTTEEATFQHHLARTDNLCLLRRCAADTAMADIEGPSPGRHERHTGRLRAKGVLPGPFVGKQGFDQK